MTEDERKLLRDVHDWLLKPDYPNRPSRAEQLDAMLKHVDVQAASDALEVMRSLKAGGKAMIWLLGLVALIGGAVAVIKGWWQ